MQQPKNDARLLNDFRNRERPAFDALYARHAGSLIGFALRLTGGCREDAEDLVQETFVAAFKNPSGFRGGSRVLTYLSGILLCRHRDARRRVLPVVVRLFEESDQHPGLPDGPASRLEARAVAGVVFEQALAKLDEPLRIAFLLVAAQGMTHKEAAALLEAPVGTIKWRVAEAARRMRATLMEMENEEPSLPQTSV